MSKFEDAFKKAGIADTARLRVLADKLLAKSDKNVFVAEDSFLEAVNKDCGLLKALVGSNLMAIARKYLESCVADMSGKKGSQSPADTHDRPAPAADIASHRKLDTQHGDARDVQTGTGKGQRAHDTQHHVANPAPARSKHKPQQPRTQVQKAGALYSAKRGLELMFAEMKLDMHVKYYELDAIAREAVVLASEKFKGSYADAKRGFFVRHAKEKCGVVLDDKQELIDILKEKTLLDIAPSAHQDTVDFFKQAHSLLQFSVFDVVHRQPEQVSP